MMVDRGHRELPIEAQFIGKKISTSTTEIVAVTFRETDTEDDVWLLDREVARAGTGLKKSSKSPAKRAPARKAAGGTKVLPKSKPVSRVVKGRTPSLRIRPKR